MEKNVSFRNQNMQELYINLIDYKKTKGSYDIANHWIRRFFRLYTDGSYSYPHNESGGDHHRRNVKLLKELKAQKGGLKSKSAQKKILSKVRSEFKGLIKVEYELSPAQTIKVLKAAFNEKQLDKFNKQLISDFTDLTY